MKMKKRVLSIFDGPHQFWKDNIMLDTDYEVRMKLSDKKAYVTDLNAPILRQADALQISTKEEKGPWISDDFIVMEPEKPMGIEL